MLVTDRLSNPTPERIQAITSPHWTQVAQVKLQSLPREAGNLFLLHTIQQIKPESPLLLSAGPENSHEQRRLKPINSRIGC